MNEENPPTRDAYFQDQEPYSQHADEHTGGVRPPADPSWPASVRDAWEHFRQARKRANELVGSCDELEYVMVDGTTLHAAIMQADRAVFEADSAYFRYTEEWYDWQLRGPQISEGREEPEAGS